MDLTLLRFKTIKSITMLIQKLVNVSNLWINLVLVFNDIGGGSLRASVHWHSSDSVSESWACTSFLKAIHWGFMNTPLWYQTFGVPDTIRHLEASRAPLDARAMSGLRSRRDFKCCAEKAWKATAQPSACSMTGPEQLVLAAKPQFSLL